MVKVPDKCLLIQAGKQFEYLTAGHVMAGFHEVVVAPETVQVINKRKQEGKCLWRVSSTMFGHIASDNILKPVGKFESESSTQSEKYPPILAGHHVQAELEAIALAHS